MAIRGSADALRSPHVPPAPPPRCSRACWELAGSCTRSGGEKQPNLAPSHINCIINAGQIIPSSLPPAFMVHDSKRRRRCRCSGLLGATGSRRLLRKYRPLLNGSFSSQTSNSRCLLHVKVKERQSPHRQVLFIISFLVNKPRNISFFVKRHD